MNHKNTELQVIYFESVLYRTISTLCVTTDCVILIDPNWLPFEIKKIQSILKKVQRDKPLILVFTHSDFDHVLGYGAFDPSYVIAHQNLFSNPRKDKILKEIQDFDSKMYVQRDYDVIYPTEGIAITKDNQTVSILDTHLHFHLAPGHTNDGIFLIVESLDLLILGDYLSNIEFPFIYHSVDEYNRTLDKVSLILDYHSIKKIISGHGDTTTDLNEIKRRISKDKYYLKHFMESDFDFEDFLKEYPFPDGLRSEHLANLKKWVDVKKG